MPHLRQGSDARKEGCGLTDEIVYEDEVGTDIAVREPVSTTLFRSEDPQAILSRASETADLLAAVVRKQKLTVTISGREHAKVEAWTLLGTLLGVFAVCTWTRKIDDGTVSGWEARVEARTRDGSLVGAAEAECLRSERTWSSRDDYALRSMAQTRATSKALRQPLGFVMQLAGFDPTPAEEIPQPQQAAANPKPTVAERKQLDTVIANLTVADPSRDWAAVVEGKVRDKFGHGIAALSKVENAQTVAAMETHLQSLQVSA